MDTLIDEMRGLSFATFWDPLTFGLLEASPQGVANQSLRKDKKTNRKVGKWLRSLNPERRSLLLSFARAERAARPPPTAPGSPLAIFPLLS